MFYPHSQPHAHFNASAKLDLRNSRPQTGHLRIHIGTPMGLLYHDRYENSLLRSPSLLPNGIRAKTSCCIRRTLAFFNWNIWFFDSAMRSASPGDPNMRAYFTAVM